MSFLTSESMAAQVRTPQNQAADPEQVANYAGGYSFEVDPWQQLDRFLILGTQGGTFYVDQTNLTEANAKVVEKLLLEDPQRVTDRIVEISREGRAIKQDYCLFALALAASSTNPTARLASYAILPHVARTASALEQFLSYTKGRRGWSRGLRNAIGRWCDRDGLAYQFSKYRNRHGFTPRDVLRLAHPTPANVQDGATYRWAVGKGLDDDHAPRLLRAIEALPQVAKEQRRAFVESERLVREHLPTEWLDDPEVQKALLKGTPLTALIRNLGVYTASGVLTGTSPETKAACELLTNQEALTKARVHPIALYLASKVYGSGRGVKGGKTWGPVNAILDALNVGFTMSFGNVVPIGGRTLFAVDVSGSMHSSNVAGMPISAAEVSAAMLTVHAHVEPAANFLAFSSKGYGPGQPVLTPSGVYLPATNGCGYWLLKIASDITIERMRQGLQQMTGGTDLSLPVQAALDGALVVDTFVIYTDSETWAGDVHLHELLKLYRARHNAKARLVVCSTASTSHTVGDPKDPLVLQAVGFDAALPDVVAGFARGEV